MTAPSGPTGPTRTSYKEEDGYQRQARLKVVTDKWPNTCPEAVAIREDIAFTPYTDLTNTQIATALEALSKRGMLAKGYVDSIEAFRADMDENVRAMSVDVASDLGNARYEMLTSILTAFDGMFPRPVKEG